MLKPKQVLCFFLVWLSYASTYFIRQPVGVVKSILSQSMGLPTSSLGWLDTSFLLFYATVQLCLPWLAVIIQPHVLLSSCLIMASISAFTTWTLLGTSLPTLCFGLAFTGSMLAPCWPASCKVLESVFPAESINIVFGLANTATYAGAMGGTLLASTMLQDDVRTIALPSVTLALFSGILVFFFLPVLKSDRQWYVDSLPVKEDSLKPLSLPGLICLPCVPQLILGVTCLKFIRYSISLWLPLSLHQFKDYTSLQAGVLASVWDMGGLFGSPLLALFLDYFYPSHPMVGIFWCLFMAICAFFTLILVDSSLFTIIILFIAGFSICGSDSLLAGSVSLKLGGPAVASFVNGAGTLGALIEGPVVGLIISWVGWNGMACLYFMLTCIGTVAIGHASLVELRNKSKLPK